MKEATFYSIGENTEIVDRDTVTFDRAINIFAEYFARLKPYYDSGAKALSETMFGFARSKDEFLEICIHNYNEISCTLSLPSDSSSALRRFFTGPLIKEETCTSPDAVIERLRQFFMLSTEEMKEALGAR